MKKIIVSIIIMAYTLGTYAGGISYTRQDSMKVVSLLREGAATLRDKTGGETPLLFYGMKLQGIPYVAHTLEVNKKEQLVVNMRQMDCTTFVETALALAMTTKQHSVRWQDFCTNLIRIRYDGGVINGYTSRNHYFLWWVESNRKQGIVTTPMDDDLATKTKMSALPSFVHRQIIKINYMSTHSTAYKMLAGQKADIRKIADHEKASFGKTMLYIPAASTGLDSSRLKYVHDGDILAIATKKAGLDTSHIGIAQWGKDGKLHLLNASQIHKKVILEPMTLQQYMKQHPSQLGIWVIHPVL